MRIRGGTRVLLFLYTLITVVLLLGAAVVAACFAIGVRPAMLPFTQAGWGIVAVGCAVVAIGGIRLLLLRKPQEARSLLVKTTESGNIAMSVDAMDALVLREARKCQQVADVKARVAQGQQGILIRLRVQVKPDVVIPEATLALQNGVKEGIEHLSGITVQDVSVFVEAAPQVTAVARVE